MRADRLVATLLLLQSRKRVTAADVAAELEVSERTARRDLEALSMAGIPVYPQPGRGGGWAPLGGARPVLAGRRAGGGGGQCGGERAPTCPGSRRMRCARFSLLPVRQRPPHPS